MGIRKVTNLQRSSKKNWAHICARSGKAVKLFGNERTDSHIPGLKGESLFLDLAVFFLSTKRRCTNSHKQIGVIKVRLCELV